MNVRERSKYDFEHRPSPLLRAAMRRVDALPVWTGISIGIAAGLVLGVSALFGLSLPLAVTAFAGALAVAIALGLRQPSEQAETGSTPAVPKPRSIDIVEIPAGEFLMGSRDDDERALDSERPRHRVRITRPFLMGRTPVTRAIYRSVMERAPDEWGDPNEDGELPATGVSWFDAVDFCNALSLLDDLQPCYRRKGDAVEWDRGADGYRLPTEAEWEYAARAGSDTAWHFGDDESQLGDFAWFGGNSEGGAQPVGRLKPNGWELHDVHGNVWEWCFDSPRPYSKEAQNDPIGEGGSAEGRVVRGGSWLDVPEDLRSAYRVGGRPSNRVGDFGFRCASPPAASLDRLSS